MLSQVSAASATSQEDHSIAAAATGLLEDALARKELFALRDISGNVSICNPIHPNYLRGTTLVANSDIAYYLIQDEKGYIACVTVCSENGEILSVSFDTAIASALEKYAVTGGFRLAADSGKLYIKTQDAVMIAVGGDNDSRSAAESDAVAARIQAVSVRLDSPSVMQALQITIPQAIPCQCKLLCAICSTGRPFNLLDCCGWLVRAVLYRQYLCKSYSARFGKYGWSGRSSRYNGRCAESAFSGVSHQYHFLLWFVKYFHNYHQ